MSCGFVLASYNTAGIIIEDHLAWNHIKTISITSSGILGLMLGSLLCEKFLVFGRVKSIYIANLIIVCSVPLQMWLTVPGLIAGRLLLGFGSGMCLVTSSTFMAETVPA